LTPYDAGGSVTNVNISPDGRYVSYLLTGGGGIHTANGHYYLLDLETMEAAQISPDAPIDDTPLRRGGVFSPDGTQIAWAEYADGNTRVLTYDIPSETVSVLTEQFTLGYQDAGIALPSLTWGEGGLAYAFGSRSRGSYVNIIQPDGSVTRVVAFFESGYYPRFVGWGRGAAGEPVLVWREEGRWFSVDPTAAEASPATTRVQEAIPNSPTYRVPGLDVEGVFVDPEGDARNEWQVFWGEPMVARFNPDISPSPWASDTYSVYGDDLIAASRDGLLRFAPANLAASDFEVLDGDSFWRIHNYGGEFHFSTVEQTEVQVLADTCALPARLAVGERARVVPGLGANSVRENTGIDTTVLGNLEPGQTFVVEGGAYCAGGYIWYRLDFNGENGYTAAGDPETGTYWLDPLSRRPNDTYTTESILAGGNTTGAWCFRRSGTCALQWQLGGHYPPNPTRRESRVFLDVALAQSHS
jgi:hypothetical protein